PGRAVRKRRRGRAGRSEHRR
ncbi:hypothetical protein NJB1728f31_08090, partial [Mycobacterium marinum]